MHLRGAGCRRVAASATGALARFQAPNFASINLRASAIEMSPEIAMAAWSGTYFLMKGHQIGTGRLIEGLSGHRNAGRRMITEHHLVCHFGGQEVGLDRCCTGSRAMRCL